MTKAKTKAKRFFHLDISMIERCICSSALLTDVSPPSYTLFLHPSDLQTQFLTDRKDCYLYRLPQCRPKNLSRMAGRMWSLLAAAPQEWSGQGLPYHNAPADSPTVLCRHSLKAPRQIQSHHHRAHVRRGRSSHLHPPRRRQVRHLMDERRRSGWISSFQTYLQFLP